MIRVCTVVFMLTTMIVIGQNKTYKNSYKIGFQFGLGLGFDNIDVLDYNSYNFRNERISSGEASISGGGGLHISMTNEYVIKRSISFGVALGYQASSLRPALDDTTFRLSRFTILPTIKYLIGLTPEKDQTINLGIGYGFYTNIQMKVALRDLFAEGELDYNNTSGINLLIEYEGKIVEKLGMYFGVRYYGVTYEVKESIRSTDFDQLNGSGIDFYMGINYYL